MVGEAFMLYAALSLASRKRKDEEQQTRRASWRGAPPSHADPKRIIIVQTPGEAVAVVALDKQAT